MKKGIFILLLAGVFAACSGNKKSEKDIIESDSVQVISTANEELRGYIVQVGDTAPDFSMVLATTGDTVKLSQLRGKLVMLQFTASWCGVCREEMPHIETEIWQKHKDNPNFALLGIDRDEPAETVLNFIKTTGVTYPIGLDPNADIFGLYADKDAGITRNVIIDKDGKIQMLTRLYDPQEFAQMTELINEILK